MTSILDPSAVIEKEYQSKLVITTSGVVYHGILKHADANSVTLFVPSKLVVIQRKNIEEMQDSKQSLMPTDLLKDFSEHDKRSLIAYLSGRARAPCWRRPKTRPFSSSAART